MKLRIRLELGQAIDRFFEKQPNRYVRRVEGFLDPYWCDYCRTFTDQPEKHRHGERPLD